MWKVEGEEGVYLSLGNVRVANVRCEILEFWILAPKKRILRSWRYLQHPISPYDVCATPWALHSTLACTTHYLNFSHHHKNSRPRRTDKQRERKTRKYRSRSSASEGWFTRFKPPFLFVYDKSLAGMICGEEGAFLESLMDRETDTTPWNPVLFSP